MRNFNRLLIVFCLCRLVVYKPLHVLLLLRRCNVKHQSLRLIVTRLNICIYLLQPAVVDPETCTRARSRTCQRALYFGLGHIPWMCCGRPSTLARAPPACTSNRNQYGDKIALSSQVINEYLHLILCLFHKA